MRTIWLFLLLLLGTVGCSKSEDKPRPDQSAVKRKDEGVAAKVDKPYRVVVTAQEIACEHPKKKRESIQWDQVTRIWYRTTSEGPWLPDQWLIFEGKTGSCSVPDEAQGFEKIWDELKARFPGFDYGPMIRGGTTDAKHLCWEKPG